MPRPGTLPEWATDGSAPVTEPSLPEKKAGWIAGTPLRAQYLNWWKRNVFSWVQWASASAAAKDEAQTFSEIQTFSGGASEADPAIVTPAPNAVRKLVWLIGTSGSTNAIRLYRSQAGGFEITRNARWAGTQWQVDVAGPATRFVVASSSIKFEVSPDGSTTWGEPAWLSAAIRGDQGPSPALIQFHVQAGVAVNGGESFLWPWFGKEVASAVEHKIMVPTSGKLHKLIVQSQRPPAGETATYTIRKNGADTTLAVTFDDTGAAVKKGTSANSVSVVPGDLISCKVVLSGGLGIGGSDPVVASLQLATT